MSRGDLEPISGELAAALLAYSHREGGLEKEMFEGAWVIGLLAPEPAGKQLLEEVGRRRDPAEDGPLLRRIVGDLPLLAPAAQERYGAEIKQIVLDDPEAAAEILAGFDQEVASRAIVALQRPMSDHARPLMADQADGEDPESYEERMAAATALVEANEQVLAALVTADAAPQAESFATMMLRSLSIAGRDAVERHLESLEPVSDPELTASCIEAAGIRPTSRRHRWLGVLDPSLAWAVDDGRALVGVARQLGSQLRKGNGDGDVQEIASELTRLRGEHNWSEQLGLEELIAEPVALSYEQLEEKLRTVEPLLNLDLVDSAEVAHLRARIVTGELQREHDPQFEHADAARFVVETLSEVLRAIAATDLEDVWAALQTAAWLAPLERSRLVLMVSVEGARREIALEDVPDVETILTYIAEHGEALNREVAAWVTLDPGNAAIRQTIEAYRSGVPDVMLGALREIAATADPERRLELCKPFLDVRPGRLLEALGFHEADQQGVADLLAQRYRDAPKNAEREQILLLWRALRPTEEEPRRLLIKDIMIPMATLNGEALDLVLREIDLARQPPRTKGALRSALRTGGARFGREKQVRAKLERLGWSRRAGRVRRHDVDVD